MKRSKTMVAAGMLALALVALPAMSASAVVTTLGAKSCTSENPKVAASAKSTGTTVITAYAVGTSVNATKSIPGSSTLTWKTFTTNFQYVTWTNVSATTINTTSYQCNR